MTATTLPSTLHAMGTPTIIPLKDLPRSIAWRGSASGPPPTSQHFEPHGRASPPQQPLAHHPCLGPSEHPMRLQHFSIHAPYLPSNETVIKSLVDCPNYADASARVTCPSPIIQQVFKLSLLRLCLSCRAHYWASYVGHLPTRHPPPGQYSFYTNVI